MSINNITSLGFIAFVLWLIFPGIDDYSGGVSGLITTLLLLWPAFLSGLLCLIDGCSQTIAKEVVKQFPQSPFKWLLSGILVGGFHAFLATLSILTGLWLGENVEDARAQLVILIIATDGILFLLGHVLHHILNRNIFQGFIVWRIIRVVERLGANPAFARLGAWPVVIAFILASSGDGIPHGAIMLAEIGEPKFYPMALALFATAAGGGFLAMIFLVDQHKLAGHHDCGHKHGHDHDHHHDHHHCHNHEHGSSCGHDHDHDCGHDHGPKGNHGDAAVKAAKHGLPELEPANHHHSHHHGGCNHDHHHDHHHSHDCGHDHGPTTWYDLIAASLLTGLLFHLSVEILENASVLFDFQLFFEVEVLHGLDKRIAVAIVTLVVLAIMTGKGKQAWNYQIRLIPVLLVLVAIGLGVYWFMPLSTVETQTQPAETTASPEACQPMMLNGNLIPCDSE